MIGSVDLKYYKNNKTNEDELKNLLEFHNKNGILIQIESMLSCFSNEYEMVYEHYHAIENLNHVLIHLPTTEFKQNQISNFSINIESDQLQLGALLFC